MAIVFWLVEWLHWIFSTAVPQWRRSQKKGWCCLCFGEETSMQLWLENHNLRGFFWWFITYSPSPGRFQTLLWPLPWCTFPPHTPSPSVLASSLRKLDSLSCVCSETGSPLGETMKLQKEETHPQNTFITLQEKGVKQLWSLAIFWLPKTKTNVAKRLLFKHR